jgi:4'-phosphopantetheinyl transferase
MAELASVPKQMRARFRPMNGCAPRSSFSTSIASVFIATRAIVRSILAFISTRIREATLHLRQYGKPTLSHPSSFLQFNLSHSNNLMLLGVTYGREVGVDVEEMREPVHFEMLAEHYFSPEEQWACGSPRPGRGAASFSSSGRARRRDSRLTGADWETPFRGRIRQALPVRSFEPIEGYAAAIAWKAKT